MDNLTEEDLKALLKENKRRKKGNKRAKFSKKIVFSVIALNIIFTIAILFVFLRTGNEPMALVGAWFTFTTVELWSLSKIKRAEKENKDEY